ncbi:ATP-binding cassette domain-containing protein [Gemmatimonadota bacterium]
MNDRIVLSEADVRYRHSGSVLTVRHLELEPGRVTIVTGLSGSGKSTLGHAFSGLLPYLPASCDGTVHLGDASLPLGDRKAWTGVRGRRVRWIPQEPARVFTPTRTLLPQMLEGIEDHEAASGTLDRLLEATGLPDRERLSGQYPFELSGGMLQRAAVISTFLPRPLLVVADEPTAHLDPPRALILARVVTSLARHASAAVLWITHDLRIAAALGDRVIQMTEGRIDADGSPRDLLDPFAENPLTLVRHAARLAMPT